MKIRAAFALLISLFLAACGVKNDLLLPAGREPVEEERDPSRPPQPLGQ
jgi:hypothetical protein